MSTDAVIDAALQAAPAWRRLTPVQRGERLRRAADVLEAQLPQLTAAIVESVGKPVREARGEAQRAVAIFRYVAGQGSAPTGEQYATEDPETIVLTTRLPLGIVALITPFNFPVAIPAWKLAPALLGGNAVVLKPATVAAEPARLLVEAVRQAGVPEGVVQLLEGGGAAGQALVEDARVDALSFTGSLSVGRRLALICAQRGIRSQLELGGKNSSVVLDDADLESAARDVANAAYGFAGQKCTATARVLVTRGAADRFTDLIAEATAKYVTGDPRQEETLCGPVVTAQKAAELERVVAGHTTVARAKAPAGDRFVAPTLLGEVDVTDEVWNDELFGPVLAVRAVEDLDEAVALANGGPFGLSAALYTRSSAAVRRAMQSLRAGVVAVNRPSTGLDPHVPFAGVKASGSPSREQGSAGVRFYTEEHTVYWREVGV
ncbi:MAG: aldehyde dehydrogenase [Candidatus Dormibacteria bacterium]